MNRVCVRLLSPASVTTVIGPLPEAARPLLEPLRPPLPPLLPFFLASSADIKSLKLWLKYAVPSTPFFPPPVASWGSFTSGAADLPAAAEAADFAAPDAAADAASGAAGFGASSPNALLQASDTAPVTEPTALPMLSMAEKRKENFSRSQSKKALKMPVMLSTMPEKKAPAPDQTAEMPSHAQRPRSAMYVQAARASSVMPCQRPPNQSRTPLQKATTRCPAP